MKTTLILHFQVPFFLSRPVLPNYFIMLLEIIPSNELAKMAGLRVMAMPAIEAPGSNFSLKVGLIFEGLSLTDSAAWNPVNRENEPEEGNGGCGL
jgi:hypothetical protein